MYELRVIRVLRIQDCQYGTGTVIVVVRRHSYSNCSCTSFHKF